MRKHDHLKAVMRQLDSKIMRRDIHQQDTIGQPVERCCLDGGAKGDRAVWVDVGRAACTDHLPGACEPSACASPPTNKTSSRSLKSRSTEWSVSSVIFIQRPTRSSTSCSECPRVTSMSTWMGVPSSSADK